MASYTAPGAARPSRLVSLITLSLGRPLVVAVPPVLVQILGDWTAAAFVAQCCHLSERSADSDGWFFQTHDAWHATLHLSPDQIRRCVRSSQGLVEARRRGIPGRNAYRVHWERLQALLTDLSPQVVVTPPPAPEVPQEQSGTASLSSPRPAPRLAAPPTPPPSLQREVLEQPLPNRTARDEVQRTPPVATAALTRLLEVWNTHRGTLPEASGLHQGRRRALTVFLSDCGDPEVAAQLLTDATREVAQDAFWIQKRFGLDTLLPKALGRAEAWRSRTAAAPPDPASPIPGSDFGVGQLVLYRRERYAIEAITPRYIDLYDDVNGSARILRASDDVRALRPAITDQLGWLRHEP